VLNGTRLGGIVGAGLERLLKEFSTGAWGRGGAGAAANLFSSGKVLSDQGVVVVIVVKFWVGATGVLTASGIWVVATRVLKAGQLIALDKCPGIRPVGIGKCWSQLMAKYVHLLAIKEATLHWPQGRNRRGRPRHETALAVPLG
jgi:hypothetical protein